MITKVSSLSLNCAEQNFPVATNRQYTSFCGDESQSNIAYAEAEKPRDKALLWSLATVGAAFCTTLGYLLFVGSKGARA